MAKIVISRHPDKRQVQKHAQERLSNLFLSLHNKKILFLSSGGSVFEFYENVKVPDSTRHITMAVLDERVIGKVRERNFDRFVKTKLFKKLRTNDATVLVNGVRKNESISSYATRYGNKLKNWVRTYKNGIIIITQGISTDGHTAGIAAYPDDSKSFRRLFMSRKCCSVGYDAQDRNPFPHRVTVTVDFLRRVDHSIVYIVGEKKRNTLDKVLAKKGTIWETPGRVIRTMKNVYLFTNISKK